MSSYWATSPMSSAPWARKRARTSSMSSTANMMRRMPSVFTGAFFGSALTAAGAWNLSSSSRPWPSGVRIIAISHRTFSSPTIRSTQRPSTGISPSNSIPSSTKNAFAASRSSTTMRTLSIRLSVTSFLPHLTGDARTCRWRITGTLSGQGRATRARGPLQREGRCRLHSRRGHDRGLLYDLIRPFQQGRGDREAERLGGLGVDHQLERRRLLHGQVGGLGALQDLVHKRGAAPEEIEKARPVRHETPGLHTLPDAVCRRQAAPGCEVCEPCSVGVEHRVRQYEEGSDALFGHRREYAVELVRTSSLQELKLHSQRPGGDVQFSYREPVVRIVRVREDSHTADLGDGLLEQLQLFGDPFQAGAAGHPCDVPARAREEPGANRIANGNHDDGDRLGGVLGCRRRLRPRRCDDEVHLEPDQLGRQVGQPVDPTFRISIVDDNILALNPPELAQPLPKCVEQGRPIGRGRQTKKTYPGQPSHLLSPGSARRGEETASQNPEERPPVHYSITWSARWSSAGGIVRPSAFAVLRLMTSSNVAGSWTGRSAGLAPLIIRSTYI